MVSNYNYNPNHSYNPNYNGNHNHKYNCKYNIIHNHSRRGTGWCLRTGRRCRAEG